jgi:hypothetical protein
MLVIKPITVSAQSRCFMNMQSERPSRPVGWGHLTGMPASLRNPHISVFLLKKPCFPKQGLDLGELRVRGYSWGGMLRGTPVSLMGRKFSLEYYQPSLFRPWVEPLFLPASLVGKVPLMQVIPVVPLVQGPQGDSSGCRRTSLGPETSSCLICPQSVSQLSK